MLPVTFSNKIKTFFSKTLLLKLAVTLVYLGFVLLLYFLHIPCLMNACQKINDSTVEQ